MNHSMKLWVDRGLWKICSCINSVSRDISTTVAQVTP
jgi:hypothetical protein